MPNFTSGCPSIAFSDANRTVHAIASSSPPPSAYPLIAATIGFGDCSNRRNNCCPRQENAAASTGVVASISAMSAPAMNAFSPAPVTIAARIEPSFKTRSSAAAMSSNTARDSAFRFSGRLMVMIATPLSSVSKRMWLKDING